MAKSSGGGNDQLVNLQAQQLAAQVANWAAQLEFQKERMRLLELPEMQGKLQVDIDKLAWQKAQDTWERAIKEATLTGKYNGQDTVEWMTQQAQMTGVLNGQQTLQGKLTDAQIAQMNNSMRLANDQFVTSTTGYFNGQKTFDREKFEAGQAQDAWKFLSTLTGPSNAFKQAKAIGNMPGGMQGIMGAWAGQYSPSGFGAVGSGGQATMESLLGGGGPGSPYAYYPPPGGLAGPGTANGYPGVGGYPYGGYGGGYAAPGTAGPGGTGPGAPTPGTPTGGTPGAPAPGAPGVPGAPGAPGSGLVGHSGTMDSGFYVWLRTHGYDPGGADRDRLPEFIHNYTGLPDKDHTEYMQVGAASPASYAFDQSNWLDTNALGFAPLPGQPSAGQPPAAPPGTPPAAPGTPALPPASAQPTGTDIPGRGFAPTQWNAATQQAIAAWNAAHPGWIADGSQIGYHLAPGYAQPGTPPPPGNETGPGQWAPINAGERPPAGMDITTWLKARQGDQQGQWSQDAQGMFIFTPAANLPQFDMRTMPAPQNVAYGSQGPDTVYAMGTTMPSYVAPQQQAQFAALPQAEQQQYLAGMSTPTWGAGAQNPYSYQGAGVQAPANEWNYSLSPTGSVQVYPPGVTSNASTPDISSPYAMSPGTANNLYQFGQPNPLGGQSQDAYKAQQLAQQIAQQPSQDFRYATGAGGTAQTGPYGANPWMGAASMPLPNQINARAYNNSYQYQRELGWAGYEDAGWDKGLAQEAFARSLPKSAGPKKGSFAF